jgi:hypothetical protein
MICRQDIDHCPTNYLRKTNRYILSHPPRIPPVAGSAKVFSKHLFTSNKKHRRTSDDIVQARGFLLQNPAHRNRPKDAPPLLHSSHRLQNGNPRPEQNQGTKGHDNARKSNQGENSNAHTESPAALQAHQSPIPRRTRYSRNQTRTDTAKTACHEKSSVLSLLPPFPRHTIPVTPLRLTRCNRKLRLSTRLKHLQTRAKS